MGEEFLYTGRGSRHRKAEKPSRGVRNGMETDGRTPAYGMLVESAANKKLGYEGIIQMQPKNHPSASHGRKEKEKSTSKRVWNMERGKRRVEVLRADRRPDAGAKKRRKGGKAELITCSIHNRDIPCPNRNAELRHLESQAGSPVDSDLSNTACGRYCRAICPEPIVCFRQRWPSNPRQWPNPEEV